MTRFNSEHDCTPAPWDVKLTRGSVSGLCYQIGNLQQGQMTYAVVGYAVQPNDATLLAAAPEMASALMELLPLLESSNVMWMQDVNEEMMQAIAKAKEALAKAQAPIESNMSAPIWMTPEQWEEIPQERRIIRDRHMYLQTNSADSPIPVRIIRPDERNELLPKNYEHRLYRPERYGDA